jgi:hypothetical protein
MPSPFDAENARDNGSTGIPRRLNDSADLRVMDLLPDREIAPVT